MDDVNPAEPLADDDDEPGDNELPEELQEYANDSEGPIQPDDVDKEG